MLDFEDAWQSHEKHFLAVLYFFLLMLYRSSFDECSALHCPSRVLETKIKKKSRPDGETPTSLELCKIDMFRKIAHIQSENGEARPKKST